MSMSGVELFPKDPEDSIAIGAMAASLSQSLKATLRCPFCGHPLPCPGKPPLEPVALSVVSEDIVVVRAKKYFPVII